MAEVLDKWKQKRERDEVDELARTNLRLTSLLQAFILHDNEIREFAEIFYQAGKPVSLVWAGARARGLIDDDEEREEWERIVQEVYFPNKAVTAISGCNRLSHTITYVQPPDDPSDDEIFSEHNPTDFKTISDSSGSPSVAYVCEEPEQFFLLAGGNTGGNGADPISLPANVPNPPEMVEKTEDDGAPVDESDKSEMVCYSTLFAGLDELPKSELPWGFVGRLREHDRDGNPLEFREPIKDFCLTLGMDDKSADSIFMKFTLKWNKYPHMGKSSLNDAINLARKSPISQNYLPDNEKFGLIYSICYYRSRNEKREFFLSQEVLSGKLKIDQSEISEILRVLIAFKVIAVVNAANREEKLSADYAWIENR